MSAYTTDCPPFDACGPCGTLPSGFVRLRYFFGKRMGVADFVDEQRYHTGKHRFHNQRLHGAGLLCGLAVARQAPTEVMLRVSKGAAVDACGREIVVGYDQCIDLDAWFQRELAERGAVDATWPASALDAAGDLPLVVLIRYRDCAIGPEPAPRDACSCDAAGCDFGRIREEFELTVVTASDPEATVTMPLTPARAAVDRVVGRAVGGGAIARGLAAAASGGCPEAPSDGWLVLASVTAVVTDVAGQPHITDLAPVEPRASLLAETALLQDLQARVLAAQLEAGALVDGPEVTALTVDAAGTELTLALSGQLVAATVPADAFTLTRFDAAATPAWTPVTASTAYVSSPPRLVVTVAGVVAGGLYRLALDPAAVPPATPIVDADMRPLRPLRGVFQFGIDQPAADLIVVDPPYAR
ncbi:MAG: hypothetical protein R3B06_04715 [Kofleriaceae bacterium]